MSKYIDADKLKEKIQPLYEDAKKIAHFASQTGTSSDCAEYDEAKSIYEHILWLIDALQQEQPKEICHKCIHHGKDDDYCYNPHGGMQSLINENGVYECTGFYEKEEQPEVDLVTEYDEQFYSDPVYGKLVNRIAGIAIARHFYELGRRADK